MTYRTNLLRPRLWARPDNSHLTQISPAGLATMARVLPVPSAAWLAAAPQHRAGPHALMPSILRQLAPHAPMLALGLLFVLVLGWYVQVVQLSLTRGTAFHQAQRVAELARVAEATAVRDLRQAPPRR